jgi:hypothetical protein
VLIRLIEVYSDIGRRFSLELNWQLIRIFPRRVVVVSSHPKPKCSLAADGGSFNPQRRSKYGDFLSRGKQEHTVEYNEKNATF